MQGSPYRPILAEERLPEEWTMRRIDYMVGARDFKSLTAAQFMQDEAYYYHANATGEKLAAAMTMGGFGSVPVLDNERRLIGLVSEFDLLKAIMEGKELSRVTAAEIMTRNPISLAHTTPAMEIVRLLEEKHLIRVPIVDAEGKLMGVVARRDILEGYLKSTTQMWWF
jgi:CBS domain-containing protein